MKKVFLLIALVATVFANNACGKKDDSKPQEQPKNSLEQKLIGKWKIIQVGIDANGREVGTPISNNCQYLEFLKENKGQLVRTCQNSENNTLFTWRVIGMELFIIFTNYGTEETSSKIASATDDYITLEDALIKKNNNNFSGTNAVKVRTHYQRIR